MQITGTAAFPLLVILCSSFGCRPAPTEEGPVELHVDPKLRDAELRDLAGTWLYERMVVEGKEVPLDTIRNDFVEIEGSIVTRHVIRKGKEPDKESSTIHIDPSSTPKRYDDEWHERRKKSRLRGIYKLEGDRLTLCFDNRGPIRPASFDSPAGSTFVLTVLRRKGSD